jgi:hypothetical protein
MMINRGNNAKAADLKASSFQASQPAPGPYFDGNGWTGDMVLLTSDQFPCPRIHERTTTTEYPDD